MEVFAGAEPEGRGHRLSVLPALPGPDPPPGLAGRLDIYQPTEPWPSYGPSRSSLQHLCDLAAELRAWFSRRPQHTCPQPSALTEPQAFSTVSGSCSGPVLCTVHCRQPAPRSASPSPRPGLSSPLTVSAGSRSLRRAGGAGWSRAGSEGGRARLRLPPGVRAEAPDAGLAGLGVLQAGLTLCGAARSPGRRRAKKSVRRGCAMAGLGTGTGYRAGRKWCRAPRRFSRQAWPRPRGRNHRHGGLRAAGKWTRPGACALTL